MIGILIGDRIAGRTPRRFGVNVEVQDHFDRCNLWDWLADSGATVIREFHPEKYLRRDPMDPGLVAGIRSKADFDAWRGKLAAAPEALPWDKYLFNEPVKWLGVPDGIIGKVKAGKMEPIVSMGYYPRMFPEPLTRGLSADELAPHSAACPQAEGKAPLAEGVWERMPADDEINWRAAACAYEYYFAFMHHYTNGFGVRYFNLHNEPEFYYRNFHYPLELMPDPPKHNQKYGPGLGVPAYFMPIIMQMAVLSRIARIACEDVRSGLADPELKRDLALAGPAWDSGWEPYWKLAHPYVDICDYHHYAPDHRLFEHAHRRVAISVGNTPGRKTACTEYGRKGGAIRVSDLLFDIGPALEAAGLMMSALSFTRPDDPPCEFVTFYHFQFPATHRNYKNLVYGDMNAVDWSGQDMQLQYRSNQLYPSFDELQLRHPTAAYHMFRMLARCAPDAGAAATSYPVMDVGGNIPWPALRTLAVDTGRDLIVTILNPTTEKLPAVRVDLGMFAGRYHFAMVRETSTSRSDQVIRQARLESDMVLLDLSAESLTQLILTPLSLDRIPALRLVEKTLTPGDANGLALHQTTRFQALGIIDGEEHDLSQMNVVWSSSDYDAMPVYQGGLVVRMRAGAGVVTISANTADGAAHASVALKPV